MDAMILHTAIITFNRLELTKRVISSYLETATADWTCVVVDNASTDGTVEWLAENAGEAIALVENFYPGFACNTGWEHGLRFFDDEKRRITHFHRADNDHIFYPGWCDEAQRCFDANPRLGQLGLRTDEQEQHAEWNTGGNCIIRRELWDKGLRWDERPWPQLRDEVGPGHTEDSLMSPAVRKMGWEWGRVERLCIEPISYEAEDDPDREYYVQTWRDRGVYGF